MEERNVETPEAEPSSLISVQDAGSEIHGWHEAAIVVPPVVEPIVELVVEAAPVFEQAVHTIEHRSFAHGMNPVTVTGINT